MADKNDILIMAAAAGIFIITMALMALTLPLLPVDETRYLSVAWGMRESGNWLVPMINGAPYSHKPPLLFWLVNLVWSVTGPGIAVSRLVPVVMAAGVVFLTARLAQRLFPGRPELPLLSALLLLALPAFLLYSPLIMFDQMLSFWILLGLGFIWQAAQAPSWKAWLLAGAALGMGLITKGPVVLLHLVFPALLLPWWKPETFNRSYKSWYGGFAISLLAGAAIIFAWAIPAAISGGPEFAHMLFWGQTAGRVVSSFDHARPFYFYIPIIIGYCLPLFFWRPLWRGLAGQRNMPLPPPVKFLLSWIVPALIAFAMISGKQPHYLLPLLPGAAILAAVFSTRTGLRRLDFLFAALPCFTVFAGMAVTPLLIGHFVDRPVSHIMRDGIGAFSPLWFVIAGAVFCAAMYVLRQNMKTQALAMTLGAGLMLSLVTLQCHSRIYPNFDLRPLAAAIQPYNDKTLIWGRKYDGEISFLARHTQKLDSLNKPKQLKTWFAENPQGYAIVRYKQPSEIEGYKVLFSQPYYENKFYALIARPDRQAP